MSDITNAVISGADASAVGAALQPFADSVTTVQTVAELQKIAADLPEGSVDLYIQLPVRLTTEGSNAVEVVRNFLTEGLIRRFDAVSAMLPALSPNATVALVTGNHPGSTQAPDNVEARISLMKVLGHTLLLERGASADGEGRVDVKVLTGVVDPSRLVQLVREPQDHPVRVLGDLVDVEPTLDYGDWRDAILALEETRG